MIQLMFIVARQANDLGQQIQQKPKPSPEVISQWDVSRRTAEFFDGILGNLRVAGLTVSGTLIGLAYQFDVSPLLLATAILNIALLFIDRRFQAYLGASAGHAKKIEDEYNFCSNGLTCSINSAREKYRKHWWGGVTAPETLVVTLYGILALFSGLLFFSINWAQITSSVSSVMAFFS